LINDDGYAVTLFYFILYETIENYLKMD